MSRINMGGLPGIDAKLSAADQQVWWGTREQQEFQQAYISSAAVDAGNTPTTQLRAGLVLGKITSSGKLKAYDATATDGSDVALGVLEYGIGMLDAGGTARDKLVSYLVKGNLKASQLIGLDQRARAQLGANGRFTFDDDLPLAAGFLGPFLREVPVTQAASPYLISASENGTLFTTTGASGAVTFTLPTVAPGLRYAFYNTVDQNITINGMAGNGIVFNNAAANSIAYSTSGQKIGVGILIESNAAGTKWFAHQWSTAACTVTVA